ncbi:hypothetical protein CgunFtcFv8_017275 [Champsocephalus gunnari]|uniref:Interleukin n=1 Tax=Champsocephalus gunnari TaxID=52237 RepID=A0AAN8HR01_CHAGU|nr:hypothetical protein CgunFtcFv8_017275 [Champsocephalus gunnari]
MKLVVFCLFAVFCSSSAGTVPKRLLKEALSLLNDLRDKVELDTQMLNTLPQNIEDSCCPLKCFQDNLKSHFNTTDIRKLSWSLNRPITKKHLCSSGSDTMLQCTDCDSNPRESAGTFFTRLESLVQKAINRLSE